MAIERKNHKYYVRIPNTNGKNKYRYFYTKDEYQSYIKNNTKTKTSTQAANKSNKTVEKKKLSDIAEETINKGKKAVTTFLSNIGKTVNKTIKNTTDKIDKAIEETVNDTKKAAEKAGKKAIETADKAVAKGTKIYKSLVEGDNDNIYDVTSKSYADKISKISETKEWKDIVAKKDPEYVKKNSEGQIEYLIDDYVAKKKSPVLDVLDDIASGRKITVNKIEKDAIVAGLKETALSSITLGAIAVGVATKVLLEKSKLRQGTYDDELDALYDSISDGAKYISQYQSSPTKVTMDDVKTISQMVQNSQAIASGRTEIDEELVVETAKILMGSDVVKNSGYYKALTNMSDEERALLSALLDNMY